MKEVNDRHIIGERGVIEFHNYCNRHEPYIIFRELVKNDFGVDGEVEIVEITDSGKKSATGEVLKVQIKSTSKENSYIKNEKEDHFTFYASKDDIEYWNKFKFDLVLIIYDNRNDVLYCKKIPQINKRNKNIKSIPVTFHKIENRIRIGDNSFIKKFTNDFKTRVNYKHKDKLSTNLLKLLVFPKILFEYKTNFSNKKAIFDIIENHQAPPFILYANKIYTFYEISSNNFPEFYSQVVSESKPNLITFEELKNEPKLRNYFTENINLHIKENLGKRGIRYNTKYKRYYFKKFEDDTRKVNYRTRVHKTENERDVVNYYEYGVDTFYRHIAFEMDYLYDGNEIYIIINPKYLFTKDGKTVLDPEKITKYTNFKTAREFNNAVINQIHFILDFLCDGRDYYDTFSSKYVKIHISRPFELVTNFCIAGHEPVLTEDEENQQNILF